MESWFLRLNIEGGSEKEKEVMKFEMVDRVFKEITEENSIQILNQLSGD